MAGTTWHAFEVVSRRASGDEHLLHRLLIGVGTMRRCNSCKSLVGIKRRKGLCSGQQVSNLSDTRPRGRGGTGAVQWRAHKDCRM